VDSPLATAEERTRLSKKNLNGSDHNY